MPSERFISLAAVLDAVRDATGITQATLVERVGLGRSIVAQRVAELEAAGLIASDGLGPSTGGRAPRRLRLRAEAGLVLGIDIASNELTAGIADLAGNLQARAHEHIDLGSGPDSVLATTERIATALIHETGARDMLRSIALGLPEPVAVSNGTPVALPTLPAWDRYPVREQLAAALPPAPIWLDDRVNLLALGERRINPEAGRSRHMVYLGGGASIGAAVVVDGRIYRGARGLAGAIGHLAVPHATDIICRCGNVGCLDAVAGGTALARDGRLLAETDRSPALAAILAKTGTLRPIDITRAADHGDPAARALLHRAASTIGGGIAALVNAYNPDFVVIGGGIARAGENVLGAIRQSIRRHALPAATAGMRIELSAVDEEVAGVIGAVQFALDQLFSAAHLSTLMGVDGNQPASQLAN